MRVLRSAVLAEDQLNFLSAALRHIADAERLLADSPDQSWHLAGFAAECARKVCLTVEEFRFALGHQHGVEADQLLDLIVAIDAHAQRFPLHGWAPVGSKLAAWSESHRYDRRGTHAADAPALVRECAERHDAVLLLLWLRADADLEVL